MKLVELYKKEIKSKLKEKFNYTNDLRIPKMTKVSVNVGIGNFSKDKNYIKSVVANLAAITGQTPMVVKSRKSISSFKVRAGDAAGVAVTLRGEKMYDFIEKLVNVTFPRVRDFRGISDKKIDNTGNLSIGFKDHTAFPEIKIEKVEKIHGLEVNIATSAETREEGLELFKLLGFPFKKN